MSYGPTIFAGLILTILGNGLMFGGMIAEHSRLRQNDAQRTHFLEYGRQWTDESGVRHFTTSPTKTGENDPGPPIYLGATGSSTLVQMGPVESRTMTLDELPRTKLEGRP